MEEVKVLELPTVTLVGVTGNELPQLLQAANHSMKGIKFGAVKIFSSQASNDPRVIKTEPINSREAYNEFMMRKLADLIDTDHLLVIQGDGYVVNPAAWTNDFLKYDYIGAVWNWYPDKRVGNGGFSLRSKKLQKILAEDPVISEVFPEDHLICRTYRNYLEKYYGIKYAPDEVANKFSVENFKVPAPKNKYNGSFGFHGYLTDFSEAHLDHIPYLMKPARSNHLPPVHHNGTAKKQQMVISQHFGLGDILFCMTIANDFLESGHEVLWPVMKPYIAIQKHFPKIKFIDNATITINQEKRFIRDTSVGKVIPLRWAEKIMGQSYRWVMRAKYDFMKKDFKRWRELTWIRDREAEQNLFTYLGLKEGEKYNLINCTFRNDQTGKVKIEVDNGLRNIEMRDIPAFTLLDWGKVIENASSIHTVSTSLSYLIDVMQTTDDLHQYLRKPDEKDFIMTEYLWEKKYVFHQ